MRVRVLDSLVLDSELLRILQETISPLLNSFHLNQWTEEVQLIIKFLLWKYSVHDRGFSVGQNLLGLVYQASRNHGRRNTQLTFLFVLESLVPYLYRKLERNYANTVNPAYWRWIDTVVKASQFLNLCIFLRNGRYPSVAHRLTQLRMIPNPELQAPSADYSSSQTRQLVWHYFADFLVIVLPLIKLHRWRTYLNRLTRPSQSLPLTSASVSRSETSNDHEPAEDAFLKCCLCKDSVTIPTPVGRCTFCYYCIKSNPNVETDILDGRNSCEIHSD